MFINITAYGQLKGAFFLLIVCYQLLLVAKYNALIGK